MTPMKRRRNERICTVLWRLADVRGRRLILTSGPDFLLRVDIAEVIRQRLLTPRRLDPLVLLAFVLLVNVARDSLRVRRLLGGSSRRARLC